jgi:hypothetical protein
MSSLNLGFAPFRYPIQNARMAGGRLVRVGKSRADPDAKAYLVAEPDRARAANLIMAKTANPDDEIEDLGRASEALLRAFALAPGEIAPIDGVRPRRGATLFQLGGAGGRWRRRRALSYPGPRASRSRLRCIQSFAAQPALKHTARIVRQTRLNADRHIGRLQRTIEYACHA